MPTPQELEVQKQLARLVLEVRQLNARVTALEGRRISFTPNATLADADADIVQLDVDPEAYFRRFLTIDNG